LYRVGFTPWDTGDVPAELAAVADSAPPGRALDIGCGTGTQAVYLARQGWTVTGIDSVEQPLRRARDRAAAAGVTVEWIRADVARLAELGLAPGYALMFDRGCFHGLRPGARDAYVAAVTALAAPGATLLMMAFARNRVPAGPAGVEEGEIERRFAGWELAGAEADSGAGPGGPLRDVPRTWYRLQRP